ncbi:sugar transferase [Morganella morganii]|uniref:sugar transferase n=1 Tax=Morganella morganii TaxID=582 RepID=UPI0027961143|nr:sugar transferase [Morganella morganii]WLV39858.1 sugar transferase [Morganella morganii]
MIYLIAKRIFDFTASCLGLLLLSPFILMICCWIKMDSKGPIFFRQRRVGKDGKEFMIHKFRSMTDNTENQGQLTIGNDQRITRSGHFIRKYKLDELAQLIDVIQGTMSLVGPRPEVPKYMNLYPESIKNKILSVKPGITDLAAIEMIDENIILAKYDDPEKAYIDIIMPMKSEYYLKYVDSKSIILDIKIIFMTIYKIVKR